MFILSCRANFLQANTRRGDRRVGCDSFVLGTSIGLEETGKMVRLLLVLSRVNLHSEHIKLRDCLDFIRNSSPVTALNSVTAASGQRFIYLLKFSPPPSILFPLYLCLSSFLVSVSRVQISASI